jgi:hypothetical protein
VVGTKRIEILLRHQANEICSQNIAGIVFILVPIDTTIRLAQGNLLSWGEHLVNIGPAKRLRRVNRRWIYGPVILLVAGVTILQVLDVVARGP